jgi:two-component system, chemotaxis family, protein-glutamate methylesterase/glutaminase
MAPPGKNPAMKKDKILPETEKENSISLSAFFAIGIGASAGGINAINELVSQLPADLNAAIFIVMHLSKVAMPELFVDRIKKHTKLACKIAIDDDKIEAGTIYLAAPGSHLLIKEDRIKLGHGPEENRFRPSIDVLFRSIAASHTEKSIGIVLTGFLNDGTVGMNAIKQSGGHTIVQDPNEAEYPDMPLSVLETMNVDHCIPLKKMGETILEIINNAEIKGIIPPDTVIKESRLSEKAATSIANVSRLGEKSLYACPDCGGSLWEIDKPFLHYRCHIGHSYSERDLLYKQAESIEHTIWVSVRMMEERKVLLQKNAKTYSNKGLHKLSKQYEERVEQLEAHIEKLKNLLFSINVD